MIELEVDGIFTDGIEETVTYNDGSTSSSILAIVFYGLPENSQGNKGGGATWTLTCERDVRSDFGRGITRRIATIVIKTADVAEPKQRDIITIDGLDFRVAEVFDHA